jgi:hypothetical protein
MISHRNIDTLCHVQVLESLLGEVSSFIFRRRCCCILRLNLHDKALLITDGAHSVKEDSVVVMSNTDDAESGLHFVIQ